MGLKPTPTEILKARGSKYAKERTDANAPLFPPGSPSCPSGLPREGKAEWRRIVPQLLEAGLLSVANRAALAAYCQAWADWQEAEAKLKKEGKVLTAASGYKYVHPWVAIARNARAETVQLAATFGMTRSSAGKVQRDTVAEPDEPKEKDKGRFFKTVG